MRLIFTYLTCLTLIMKLTEVLILQFSAEQGGEH